MTEFLAEYGEKKPINDCTRDDCRIVSEDKNVEVDKYGQRVVNKQMQCKVCGKTWYTT
jgi:hypothetical protein